MIVNSHYPGIRKTGSIFFSLVFVILFIGVKDSYADAKKGQQLFEANCSTCHNPLRDATGPALYGKENEVPGGRKWIYNWVHNSSAVIASGDKYAVNLFNQWNHVEMTHFPQLTDQDINDILDYVKQVGDQAKTASTSTQGTASGNGQGTSGSSDNSLLFGILTLILAIIAVILMQINSNLNKLANDKEGIETPEPVPFYRNKAYIAIVAVCLFVAAGYFLTNAAINSGRQQNYEPTQPIFFSHRVHAGINQINCLYCHAGAEKSKHAMIPSQNICMNCHKAINSYSGEQLYTPEGKPVDGTAEIQKLYYYAGWDPQQRKYVDGGHPIEWIKIHNLPDFVYFNHSQHVVVGKIQCQTCHGPVQKMDVVYQFADLSMGWCINCHRTTKVQFTENSYYSIFTKYHEELKEGKIDSVTEAMVGGTECGRCHY
jgi:mono/diheme cytochrome c family protein